MITRETLVALAIELGMDDYARLLRDRPSMTMKEKQARFRGLQAVAGEAEPDFDAEWPVGPEHDPWNMGAARLSGDRANVERVRAAAGKWQG